MNKCTIIGNLTKAPELRTTTSGLSVCSFTVAVDRDYSSNGEKQTDFIDCIAWRQGGEFVSKYFAKGSMIAVIGRLESRKWQDRDGNKRTSWEVNADHCYFGGSKQEGERSQAAPSTPASVPAKQDGFREIPPEEDDGELPF